jgi:hypothetical protein
MASSVDFFFFSSRNAKLLVLVVFDIEFLRSLIEKHLNIFSFKNFLFKYKKAKETIDGRLLYKNLCFQKKHSSIGSLPQRESSKGILSGLYFNISDPLGENCFEDILHSLIKWKN